MSEKRKTNFEYLMEQFDWEFIKQIFEEGVKIPDFFPPNNPVQAIECDYKGWRYNLQRVPTEVIKRYQGGLNI